MDRYYYQRYSKLNIDMRGYPVEVAVLSVKQLS